MQFCKCFTVDSVYLKKIKKHCFVAIFGLVIFVSYVELLYRLASDLALKTKYYSTLFSIRNLSEIAFVLKKSVVNFCFVLIMRLRGIVLVLVPRTSRTLL